MNIPAPLLQTRSHAVHGQRLLKPRPRRDRTNTETGSGWCLAQKQRLGGLGWRRPARIAPLVVAVICAALSSACGSSETSKNAKTSATPTATASSPRSGASSASPKPISVGSEPDGEAAGDGALWVANVGDGTVDRVSVTRRQVVATIHTGGAPIAVAVTLVAVWVADDSPVGRILRIDPRTNRITAVIRVGSQPTGLVALGTRVWAFDQGDGRAYFIDAGTNRVLHSFALGNHAGLATVFNGSIWVPDFQGTSQAVWRIRPATGAVLARIPAGIKPLAIAFGAGAGWVTNLGSGTVTRFNPATGRTQATIPMPGGDQVQGVAVLNRAVWIADLSADQLVRIDPRTDRVSATVTVGAGPRDIVPFDGALWITEYGADALAEIRP